MANSPYAKGRTWMFLVGSFFVISGAGMLWGILAAWFAFGMCTLFYLLLHVLLAD